MSVKTMNPLRFSKILIVDDSAFMRTFVKRTLKEAQIGSRYYEANDGKEAISKYVAFRPDVTIMDIVMPNVDGVKATMAIKQYDPNARIIVISSKDNKETVQDVVEKGGARDYLLKPCDSSAIVMAVSKQIVVSRHKKKQ
ncbi:two-component system response regulator [Nitrosopumilus ureiphilus]|uniref:Two-component system response regulator n=2 Tax=Nitrosopumilus ureiphilus TaxID=1470067 RepID=A0A7D5M4X1_9ARCH|nr:two-component system response regulator [Nitrosopumilus ureiphilus]